MAEGHGVKNWNAMLSSNAFKNATDSPDIKIDLQIPSELMLRLEAVAGKSESWGVDQIFIEEEVSDIASWKSRWEACRRLVRQLRKNSYESVLIMYGDSILFLLPLIRFFCPKTAVSCLIFRPAIHYKSMGYKAGIAAGEERDNRIPILKNALLLLFMKIKLINRVAFQDDGAVEWYKKHKVDALWFPTPPATSKYEVLQLSDKDKFVFTLFGALAERKGVFKVLAAFQRLPNSMRTKVQLQFIGRAVEADRKRIHDSVDVVRSDGFDVILDDRFVDYEEIESIYRGSDVMLLLYEGSLVAGSGVLIQALAYGKPVLTTDVGWVGKVVTKECLGLAVDTQSVENISKALVDFYEQKVSVDSSHLIELAKQHDPERYGEVMVQMLSVEF